MTPIVYDEKGIQIQSGSSDVVKISKTDKKEPLGEPRRAKEKFLMTPSKKGAIYISTPETRFSEHGCQTSFVH